MTYTILAYKPDSNDYVRGCHMASYAADFQWKATTDKQEAIEFLASIHLLNSKLDFNESGYEITILVTGDKPTYAEEESDAIAAAGESLGSKLVKEAKEDKEKKEAALIEDMRRQENEADRKEFERLKTKLGV